MGSSSNSSRFHSTLYLRISFHLAGSPPLEHGLTRVSDLRRRELFEYARPRQSRARRVKEKRCRTRMSAVNPLIGEAVLRKRCMRYVVPSQGPSVKFYRPTNKGNGAEEVI